MVRDIWNLPNRITLGRLGLAVALFVVLALVKDARLPTPGLVGWLAFGLFVVAAATDWVDGYLARRLGLVTTFGRIMDPFVDKVVVCGTFVFLTVIDHEGLPAWIVVVILGREFFVNAIRGFMESRGVSFAAEMPGKIKMFLQCLALGALLLELAIGSAAWLGIVSTILVYAALVSTVHSGAYYAKKAFERLHEMEG